jgi:hypothetical protein
VRTIARARRLTRRYRDAALTPDEIAAGLESGRLDWTLDEVLAALPSDFREAVIDELARQLAEED